MDTVASKVGASPGAAIEPLLQELVAHLRRERSGLREEWVRRIGEAQLLTAMGAEEIFAEATSAYDKYMEALATGTLQALQAYAQELSERIIPRGVQTHEVVGIVLLLRDVLARSLFAKYQSDFVLLNRVLDAYEPAANRIATTVAVGFVQERERTILQQQQATRALRYLNEAMEAGIKRIAHALHDNAGQLLAALRLAIADLAGELPAGARGRVAAIERMLEDMEAELRNLSHELRPTMLDSLGLRAALDFLAESVGKRTGLAISVAWDAEGRLPPAVETALYRSVQEALNNIVKYAQARTVSIALQANGEAVLARISDDGIGFDAAGPEQGAGLGLIGIRERLQALGGHLQIHTAVGSGTTLRAEIPLPR